MLHKRKLKLTMLFSALIPEGEKYLQTVSLTCLPVQMVPNKLEFSRYLLHFSHCWRSRFAIHLQTPVLTRTWSYSRLIHRLDGNFALLSIVLKLSADVSWVMSSFLKCNHHRFITQSREMDICLVSPSLKSCCLCFPVTEKWFRKYIPLFSQIQKD